jgi:hypothetical protein
VRKILVIGAIVLLVGSAHAQATKGQETAPATPAVSEPQAAPSPAVSAPAAPAVEAPATAQGPATQAQPATAAAAPTPKPGKKRQARRYESDEQKARRIAAKYGISW